jgi:hypothetical protein
VLLASESGGALAPGIYYLRADQLPTRNFPIRQGLAVVTANITIKQGPEGSLIWVTDLATAEPVAQAAISIYNRHGTRLDSGLTDDNGLFSTEVYQFDDDEYDRKTGLYVVAEGENLYGVWYANGIDNPPAEIAYIYTDRPIYRPGETVYFRGIVRLQDDLAYPLMSDETVHIRIQDRRSRDLWEGDLPLNDFGTFDGSLVLPDDVAIGEAQIYVADYTFGYFTVAEYRVPEYRVEVIPEAETVIKGDSLKVVTAASYYAGGPVSDANVRWAANGKWTWFNYAC